MSAPSNGQPKAPDDRLISKIQALLNMTIENGCTEGEAANAVEQAQRLLLEYGLSMESVRSSETEKDQPSFSVTQEGFAAKKVMRSQHLWQLALANGICRVTCTKLLIRKIRYRGSENDAYYFFVGTPTNIKVAIKMFEWLSDQMLRIAIDERLKIRIKRKATKAQEFYTGPNFLMSFMVGITGRVTARLRDEFAHMVDELNAKDYVLARYDEAEAFVRENSTGSFNDKSSTRINERAYRQGHAKGDQVRLNQSESIDFGGPAALERRTS